MTNNDLENMSAEFAMNAFIVIVPTAWLDNPKNWETRREYSDSFTHGYRDNKRYIGPALTIDWESAFDEFGVGDDEDFDVDAHLADLWERFGGDGFEYGCVA